MASDEKIFQIKVTLIGSNPSIWRLIEIEESASFYDLHWAIQKAMGWDFSHLHEFTFGSRRNRMRIGMREEGFDLMDDVLNEDEEILSNYRGLLAGKNAGYTYDFGDCWDHALKLKKILPKQEGVRYSRCIDGRLACPPEDCGGIQTYKYYLNAYNNKDDENHKEAVEILGEEFDSERFDILDIDL
jgi:hypothetical protein